MAAGFIALILALAAAGQSGTAEKWTTATPPGAGFTIQGARHQEGGSERSLKFSFVTEDSAFMVEIDPLEAAIAKAVSDSASGATELLPAEEERPGRRQTVGAHYRGDQESRVRHLAKARHHMRVRART